MQSIDFNTVAKLVLVLKSGPNEVSLSRFLPEPRVLTYQNMVKPLRREVR